MNQDHACAQMAARRISDIARRRADRRHRIDEVVARLFVFQYGTDQRIAS
jgi:hypothetical protein